MTDLVIVGEAWGRDEELVGKPFVGASGINLIKLLDQVGLMVLTQQDRQHIHAYYCTAGGDPYQTAEIWAAHPEIFVTNVFNVRPKPSNDIKNLCGTKKEGITNWPALQRGKYVKLEYVHELGRLGDELNSKKPKMIIALGATPAWFLLQTDGIKGIRGCTAMSHFGKVLPTYHPAAMLRDWSLRPIILTDLDKAKKDMDTVGLKRIPRAVWIEPTTEDLAVFQMNYIETANVVSVDIENMGPVITCVGFATDIGRAIVVPFYDKRQPDRNYWRTFEEEKKAWEFVRHVLATKRTIFQNGAYDMHHLWKTMGLPTSHAIADTMLLHHALQPEMEKGLGFLGSVYVNEFPWKTMRGEIQTIKGED